MIPLIYHVPSENPFNYGADTSTWWKPEMQAAPSLTSWRRRTINAVTVPPIIQINTAMPLCLSKESRLQPTDLWARRTATSASTVCREAEHWFRLSDRSLIGHVTCKQPKSQYLGWCSNCTCLLQFWLECIWIALLSKAICSVASDSHIYTLTMCQNPTGSNRGGTERNRSAQSWGSNMKAPRKSFCGNLSEFTSLQIF